MFVVGGRSAVGFLVSRWVVLFVWVPGSVMFVVFVLTVQFIVGGQGYCIWKCL